MNHEDDPSIAQLYATLRQADAEVVPDFDRVVSRSLVSRPSRNHDWHKSVLVSVVAVAASIAFVAIPILFSDRQPRRPEVAAIVSNDISDKVELPGVNMFCDDLLQALKVYDTTDNSFALARWQGTTDVVLLGSTLAEGNGAE